MAATFLSDDWFAAANAAISGHEAFQAAIAGKDLGAGFVVTDGDNGGPLNYGLAIVDGVATIAKGELEAADVTITSDYESAMGIAKGELNTQMAFMTGKIKVAGNLAMLMMHQNIITQWANLAENLDTEY
jgi:putative sterol carrier protein